MLSSLFNTADQHSIQIRDNTPYFNFAASPSSSSWSSGMWQRAGGGLTTTSSSQSTSHSCSSSRFSWTPSTGFFINFIKYYPTYNPLKFITYCLYNNKYALDFKHSLGGDPRQYCRRWSNFCQLTDGCFTSWAIDELKTFFTLWSQAYLDHTVLHILLGSWVVFSVGCPRWHSFGYWHTSLPFYMWVIWSYPKGSPNKYGCIQIIQLIWKNTI